MMIEVVVPKLCVVELIFQDKNRNCPGKMNYRVEVLDGLLAKLFRVRSHGNCSNHKLTPKILRCFFFQLYT